MKTDEQEQEPETDAAADAGSELSELREQLTKCERQKDDMLRTLADYENSRKRAARDLELERKFAHAKLATDLLPALDNLDRALSAAKGAGDKNALVQGVQATQSQLLDAFKRHGIVPIEAAGQPFDPNVHQAVQMMPSPDQEPNTVLQVLQQGFMIYDRVLRPAAVVVSAPS